MKSNNHGIIKQPNRQGKGRETKLEFHVRKDIRDKYKLEEDLFSLKGDVVLPNFHAVRLFTKKINDGKNLVQYPETAIRAGHLNALGLINEIFHYVVSSYMEEEDSIIFEELLSSLQHRFGKTEVNNLLIAFAKDFPAGETYRQKLSAEEYLLGKTDGTANPLIVLEEILMLWLNNTNTAAKDFYELFSDSNLISSTIYKEVLEECCLFFRNKPVYGPEKQDLITMLRTPALIIPDSLPGQLEWIKENWGSFLGSFLTRLLTGIDLIREEEKSFFRGTGPGPTQTLEYQGVENDPERFSPDKDWMPRVIIMAKSTLVWLDQLSKQYKREIKTLDQIPEEELVLLQERGFTGLWLIGLWERSHASKVIKQKCGNPDAEASAYSLFDYDISEELGGWTALENLRQRCWNKGIRLASDMVPNHTGIDSKWITDHPDYFIQLDYPPFPSYSFSGDNLSRDSRYGLYLEDHYYDKTDASVVFKYIHFQSGETRYIYHGNDGTHMPWNDTAQINFLNAEAREAVIQKVLLVARNFPIIRFDAAMTLAKKHIQRLWYPEPGHGGDIPSRAEHALSQQDFNHAIPEEFWREVVDRVAKEIPDTLLLAEAFWMMESYFVRTLGMHRVYNSAFMNMLKNEENSKYRDTIKNTLEFDPEILKRFVNFMNNPDEDTAIAQFGKGDKYFGICTMMITMPGLPMFGHGQIEGFTEKYGMEYRKAYWEEQPDGELIDRHYRQIFPLSQKRYLFADAQDFHLYDLWTADQKVNENVFAYSNQHQQERALVLYNNSYESCQGWINTSAEFVVKDDNGEKEKKTVTLGKAFGLSDDSNCFCILREFNSNLWYIRNSREIYQSGLFVSLQGYESQVFVDIYQVTDNGEGHYRRLAEELNGRGVPNINNALKEILFRPVYRQLDRFLNSEYISLLRQEKITGKDWKQWSLEIQDSLTGIKDFIAGTGDPKKISTNLVINMKSIPTLLNFSTVYMSSRAKGMKDIRNLFLQKVEDSDPLFFTILGSTLFRKLGQLINEDINDLETSLSMMDDWLLLDKYREYLISAGIEYEQSRKITENIRLLTAVKSWIIPPSDPGAYMEKLLKKEEVRSYLQENRYNDILWFNKERFEELTWWLLASEILSIISSEKDKKTLPRKFSRLYAIIEKWKVASESSEYQITKLLKALEK